MLATIPYPDLSEDTRQQDAEACRARALRHISASDLISVVEDLVSQISAEQEHPLFRLATYVLQHGTTHMSGQRPYVTEQVGVLYERIMDEAITRLVDERLMNDDGEWE